MTWPPFRDAASLAKLPEAERKDWLALWDEVEALIRKADEAKPPVKSDGAA
jgi:hypothetical protein